MTCVWGNLARKSFTIASFLRGRNTAMLTRLGAAGKPLDSQPCLSPFYSVWGNSDWITFLMQCPVLICASPGTGELRRD